MVREDLSLSMLKSNLKNNLQYLLKNLKILVLLFWVDVVKQKPSHIKEMAKLK